MTYDWLIAWLLILWKLLSYCSEIAFFIVNLNGNTALPTTQQSLTLCKFVISAYCLSHTSI